MDEPCGKEEAGEETGWKVLVGGGSRMEKRSVCRDVGWMASILQPTRCSGRCETSGSTIMPGTSLKEAGGPPSSSKGHKERAVRPRGRRSVCATRHLCCVCFGVGEANEFNWEKSKIGRAHV